MAVNVGQRNVPDTEIVQKCYAVDSALSLLCHTLNCCKNKKFLEDGLNESVTNKITDIATDIYLNAYTANRVRLTAENVAERDAYQRVAISKCNELIAMLNVAKRVFHLRKGKVENWIRLAIGTRELLNKWRDANRKVKS